MLLFSTVLFIDGNPIGYEVYCDESNRLALNPAENPNRETQPPLIYANNVNGKWKVEGTHNPDLISQVLEEISLNGQLPKHRQSASP